MPKLDSDSNLDRLSEVEGYKVLPPCVLYGKIGQGGMGAVYRGRHLNLDIDVAVKCLKPDLTGEDEQFVVRFRREARSAARINHQNVVRVFDVSEERGLHYIVMELVQGETARQRVQRKGKLSVGEALEILHGAAAGLGEAHSKAFIHRDIKPDNIMIASSGAVKVADLGLAKPSGQNQMSMLSGSMLSGTNVVMGTPQYMPPEQWENTATVTPAADVWALGATLYYLLIGGEAIAGDSLPRIMQRIVLQPFPDVREKRDDVPDDVAEFVKRATAKSPDDRFADAGEMLEAIERLTTRRDSLRDNGAVSDGEQNTLLSPPPAKTMAKIKFWMDEQGRPGGSSDADAGEPVGDEGATIVSPARRRSGDAGDRRRATDGNDGLHHGGAGSGARRGVVAVALLVLAAVVLLLWQPWSPPSPFAEAERLARAGQFEPAASQFLSAFAADPTQTGKSERMAALHLQWAQSLCDRQELCGSLEQVARSVEYRATPEAGNLKRAVLAKAAMAVDAELERTEPGSRTVATGPVRFAGRLAASIVQKLVLGGAPVEVLADGRFEAVRDPQGQASIEVAAELTTGDRVTLAPWALAYDGGGAPPASSGKDNAPSVASAGKPAGEEPKAAQQPMLAPAKAGPTTLKPVPSLAIAPERLELRGDSEATLTIEAPAEADIRIDGQVVVRNPGDTDYTHRVRSSLLQPQAIEVVVAMAGRESRRTVPVVRIPGALAFAKAAQFAKLAQRRGDRWATDRDSVQIRGECNERPTRLLVNGKPVAKVRWQGNVFTFSTAIENGVNRLQLSAERRFYRGCQQQLEVERLGAPRLRVAGGTRTAASVSSDRYSVCVDADPWTTSVEASNGKAKVQLRRDANTQRFRGEVRLLIGDNRIVVRARNVLGKRGDLALDIVRSAKAGNLPRIRTVRVIVAGKPVEVRNGKQVHLRSAGSMVVDGGADSKGDTVRINGKPVARQADGSVSLAGLLRESKASKIELVLQNARGQSQPYVFFAWLDTGLPAAECSEPMTVAKGQPFELRGTWADAGGLDRNRCKLGALTVRLSPRGVAPSGTWKVQHPGLDATTTLTLLVVDRAGNQTSVAVQVVVE